jgi:aryl-alcohol dehydrogenase-like predicted oxidoreductase
MERVRLGKTDMEVSRLGFGGAETGFGQHAAEQVAAILNVALDAGLNVVDTAECYGTGEETIGKAVSSRRSDYYLFTKCGHSVIPDLPDWDPRMLEQSIDRSLKLLRTDHVDLLQVHSCDEAILRAGEVIEVVQRAKAAGKTRYIGYSGDGAAAHYALQCGAFDTLQTSLSIADQEGIDLNLPLARAQGVGVIVKRSIANAAWRYGATCDNDYHRPYWERLRVLDYPFLKGDPAEAAATALRFTLSLPGVQNILIGTTNPGRWKENMATIARGPLPQAEVDAIRARWKAVAKPDWVGQI